MNGFNKFFLFLTIELLFFNNVLAQTAVGASTLQPIDMTGDNQSAVTAQNGVAAPRDSRISGVRWGQTVTIVGGEMSGTFTGALGKLMDVKDSWLHKDRICEAVENHSFETWVNAHTHRRFTFSVTARFTDPDGNPCRNYTAQVVYNNDTKNFKGIVCRDNNGEWQFDS